jgi:hypothetical protein
MSLPERVNEWLYTREIYASDLLAIGLFTTSCATWGLGDHSFAGAVLMWLFVNLVSAVWRWIRK